MFSPFSGYFITASLPTFEIRPQTVKFSALGVQEGEIYPDSYGQLRDYGGKDIEFATKFTLDKDLSTFASSAPDAGNNTQWFSFRKTVIVNKIVIYTRFKTNW